MIQIPIMVHLWHPNLEINTLGTWIDHGYLHEQWRNHIHASLAQMIICKFIKSAHPLRIGTGFDALNYNTTYASFFLYIFSLVHVLALARLFWAKGIEFSIQT